MYTSILLTYLLCFSSPSPSPVDDICCCLKQNMSPTVLFSSKLYLQKPPQSRVFAVCLKYNMSKALSKEIILVCGNMNNTDSRRNDVLSSVFHLFFLTPVTCFQKSITCSKEKRQNNYFYLNTSCQRFSEIIFVNQEMK